MQFPKVVHVRAEWSQVGIPTGWQARRRGWEGAAWVCRALLMLLPTDLLTGASCWHGLDSAAAGQAAGRLGAQDQAGAHFDVNAVRLAHECTPPGRASRKPDLEMCVCGPGLLGIGGLRPPRSGDFTCQLSPSSCQLMPPQRACARGSTWPGCAMPLCPVLTNHVDVVLLPSHACMPCIQCSAAYSFVCSLLPCLPARFLLAC